MNNFEKPMTSPDEVVVQEKEGKIEIIPFQNVDGQKEQAVHLSLEGEIDRSLREDDQVEVRGTTGLITLSFGEYLARLGLDHGRYFKAMKTRPDDSPADIIRDLHKEVIAERSSVATRQHKKYTHESNDRDNLQQETAKAHGPFFNQMINDLGIDGLTAKEAPARVDYLDGIDEFIRINHRALETDGEDESGMAVTIGIQRSFKDKSAQIAADRVRFIPEDPEAGPVFRVFLLEDLKDYIDLAEDETLYQKLLSIRSQRAREAGLSPNDYAKGKKNEGLPTVDKVLPGGVKEQVRRVSSILGEIKKQLGGYIDSSAFENQPQAVQNSLRRQYEEINLDDFIGAVEELVA